MNMSQTHLSLRERCLHVFQQTGQVLFTVTHHQKQTAQETEDYRNTDHSKKGYGDNMNYLYSRSDGVDL